VPRNDSAPAASAARGRLPALFLLLAALFPFMTAAPPAQAAFVKQPYLQNLTDTSIVIRWETSAAQGGKVQFGFSTSYGSEFSQGSDTTQHELLLAGLLPDTLYHYRAISDPDTSADAVFHIPVGISGSFRFIAYGDNRTNAAPHQSVVDQMALVDPPPGFLVNVGDLTAGGSTSDYQTFFNIEKGILSRAPLFPTVGNHDTSNMTNWATLFALPNNERWYSFRYGNSSFHFLDNYSTYTPGSPQYTWFLNELSADSADATVRHIFVSFHNPPYTTNLGHSSDLNVRQYICPLLERFHVQVAFMGHVHCYEHSLANGVHYVVTGGGGAPLYSSWGPAQPWTVYRETTYEFTLVDVRGDTVDVKTVKPGGAEIDPFQVVREPTPATAQDDTASIRQGRTFRASPNPHTGIVRLTFDLSVAGPVEIEIHDVAGRRVATLVSREMGTGPHDASWDGSRAASGTYFAVLRTRGQVESLRLVLIR
jgi:acid phosphatase type 7